MRFEGNLAILKPMEERALWNVLPAERRNLQVLDGEVFAARLALVLDRNFPEHERAPEPFKTMLGQLASHTVEEFDERLATHELE